MATYTDGKDLDQAQRRKPAILRDQWGRKWETTVDVTPGAGPCAPINPKGWTDRLNTPVKFKRIVADEDGRMALEIAVDEWIADAEKAHERYDQDLYNDALMLFGAEGPKAYEERSPALLNYTGLPPQALEPLYALKDENPWILGITETPDKRLVEFFTKKQRVRPSFKPQPETLAERMEEEHDPEATGGKKQPVRRKVEQVA